jgi:hypothetical protein
MIIGDFTGVLYAVIAVLGVLLACYGAALLVSFRASRPRAAAKGAQPTFSSAPKAV